MGRPQRWFFKILKKYELFLKRLGRSSVFKQAGIGMKQTLIRCSHHVHADSALLN